MANKKKKLINNPSTLTHLSSHTPRKITRRRATTHPTGRIAQSPPLRPRAHNVIVSSFPVEPQVEPDGNRVRTTRPLNRQSHRLSLPGATPRRRWRAAPHLSHTVLQEIYLQNCRRRGQQQVLKASKVLLQVDMGEPVPEWVEGLVRSKWF